MMITTCSVLVISSLEKLFVGLTLFCNFLQFFVYNFVYKGGNKLNRETRIILKSNIGRQISAVEDNSDKISPAWQQAKLYGIEPKNIDVENIPSGIYNNGDAILSSLIINK